ncbi:MAG: Methyltransferase type 11 [Candidatus Azambacteria bacterium GW2011_GWE1_42_9]|nr:MAG: Methyltransferase type 11 [Candidatus Azambacteria bacterium GW2011_GWF1_41_10]KKS49264.1 MAG: Methyltransferase type 11 [Candidatus Azambacteria bacterium GW2011_GWF2_42_22]KKS69379.1 MAG: Methyltransferase type 11 [Candidatus Azambacteria bacterium GW2011_GWA2_42_62]KKS79383.1 MAG: Methyltransferase type 11 [Candidatus Azambacteria bacterium GW2011_GWE1_42_9]KKT03156.1 MAG: Methyltransferase type 11 [Candidatus Azambacteria bacterium GW2011_GWD1_43_18]KKT12094.1 MAG: Methyltransferas
MAKELYNKYFETHFPKVEYRDKMWHPVVEYLQKKYVPKNSIVLDLGAGYCNFINHIVAKEKHASDISEIIKQNAEKDVICHIQDCAELSDISDEKFDIVFESNLLEHLDSDRIEKTLKEILRVLKKGGRFIAMQPNYKYFYAHYFDDYTHKTILSHVSFENLLKNYGFEIENIEPKFLPATFKQKLPKIPFLVKLYLRSPWRPAAKQMLAVAKKPNV